MIEPSQIADLIQFNSDKLKRDIAYHKEINFQITGKGKEYQVHTIKGFESKTIRDIREKYTQPIDWLWAWILNPVNKIFSAHGGSINIDMDKPEDLIDKTRNITSFMTLRHWMKKVLFEQYITNPAGVVLMEYEDKEKCYPVIYSIESIESYNISHRYIDWIIFKPIKAKVGSKVVELYRVYDETGDQMYKRNGKDFVKVDSYIDLSSGQEKKGYYPIPANWKGVMGKSVPGFILGDQIDSNNKLSRLTLIDKSLGKGSEYFTMDTLRIFSAIKNGYGTPYWYTRPCGKCKGEGEINGEKCKACDGSGRVFPQNINDLFLIHVDDETDSKLPEKPGGVIEGDVKGWQEYRKQQFENARDMERSFYGTNRDIEKPDTATASFINNDSVSDKLSDIATSMSIIETIILNYSGHFYFGSRFKGAYSTYGIRFIAERPDVLLKKYQDAKSAGVGLSVLNRLLIEYFASEYKNDSSMFNRMIMLMKVEPNIHLNVSEYAATQPDPQDLKRKKYVAEWEASLSNDDINDSTPEKLIKELDKFINTKQDGQINQGGEGS